MNYKYFVNAHFEKAETTLRTNDVRIAIQEFFDYIADGVHCDIVNGFTGEVLAIACSPEGEDYATEEMALMMLGFLAEEAWGEEDEDENAEFCQSCGGQVVDSVCQFCGRCVECEDEDEMTTAEGMVLGLIQALGGLPS